MAATDMSKSGVRSHRQIVVRSVPTARAKSQLGMGSDVVRDRSPRAPYGSALVDGLHVGDKPQVGIAPPLGVSEHSRDDGAQLG